MTRSADVRAAGFLRHYISVATELCQLRLKSAPMLGQLSFMATPILVDERPMDPDMLTQAPFRS